MLGADDPLPGRPRRILVAGTSGAGKTTLAGRIGRALDLPHTEIDSLYHGPGWVPRESFEADVRQIAAGPEWVFEWQYSAVRDLLAARAELLIWLDLPHRLVMRQVIGRTLRRRISRRPIWNGNREGPLWRVLTDPEHVVRWAWSTHWKTPVRVAQQCACHPELPVVRLRTRAEVRRWAARLQRGSPGEPRSSGGFHAPWAHGIPPIRAGRAGRARGGPSGQAAQVGPGQGAAG